MKERIVKACNLYFGEILIIVRKTEKKAFRYMSDRRVGAGFFMILDKKGKFKQRVRKDPLPRRFAVRRPVRRVRNFRVGGRFRLHHNGFQFRPRTKFQKKRYTDVRFFRGKIGIDRKIYFARKNVRRLFGKSYNRNAYFA